MSTLEKRRRVRASAALVAIAGATTVLWLFQPARATRAELRAEVAKLAEAQAEQRELLEVVRSQPLRSHAAELEPGLLPFTGSAPLQAGVTAAEEQRSDPDQTHALSEPELAAEADAMQAEEEVRELERYGELADSLDARLAQGTPDPKTHAVLAERLVAASVAHRPAPGDGCSDQICSFGVAVDGALVDAHTQALPLLKQSGFANVLMLRVEDGQVRLFATRPGVPLRATSDDGRDAR